MAFLFTSSIWRSRFCCSACWRPPICRKLSPGVISSVITPVRSGFLGSHCTSHGLGLVSHWARPEFLLSDFDGLPISCPAVAAPYKDEVLLEAETTIKYRGYIDRSNVHINKVIRSDMVEIDPHFNYNSVVGLSSESREKLCSIKPETLGQAMRISGVTPADISVLSIFISKHDRVSRET